MADRVQIVGRTFLFDFGEDAKYQLHFVAADKLEVTVVADANNAAGTLNKFTITMTELRADLYMVIWVEGDTGNTVTHVQDYENLFAYTNITDLASRAFWNLRGTITPLDDAS